MLIVLSIYAGVIYLVFGKLKLLPWNTTWKTVSGAVGLVIALVIIGALNYLAPSGRVTVQGYTVEITPNVSGTVVSVEVEANTPVKQGDVLFRIDPIPFQTEVGRLEAALAEAQTAVSMRQTDLEAVTAEIEGLQVQLSFGETRRDDIVKLADRGVNSKFQLQEAVSTIGQLEAGIRAAKSRKQGLELRIASQVDGVDTSVMQVQQSLENAQWKLDQAVVRAPQDGVVTALSLSAGARVAILKSAMAFVPARDRALTGVFSQTAAKAFAPGTEVLVAMRSMPGTYFTTTIDAVIPGTSEGSLPREGVLAL